MSGNTLTRILTLDGGGIYGYTTARLLCQLCRDNETFLAPGQIDLFSGTSAGSLNALLLAKSDNPRETILSGELDKFWNEPDLFAGYLNPANPLAPENFNPLNWIKEQYSTMGLIGFYPEDKFINVLQKYFSDMTLGQLKNNAMVSVFNLYGNSNLPDSERAWEVENVTNLDDKKYGDMRIVDLLYGAGSPPGMRPIRNGLTDGGLFAPNPAIEGLSRTVKAKRFKIFLRMQHINAFIEILKAVVGLPEFATKIQQFFSSHIGIAGSLNFDAALGKKWTHLEGFFSALLGASVIEKLERDVDGLDKLLGFLKAWLDHALTEQVKYYKDNKLSDGKTLDAKVLEKNIRVVLEKVQDAADLAFGKSMRSIRLLSVGVGNKTPALMHKDFDVGSTLFSKLPTNPMQGNLWPAPSFLAMDAPSGASSQNSFDIMGDHFFRLNPPLLGYPDSMPTLNAAFAAKNPFVAQHIRQQIENLTSATNPVTREALQQTNHFLEKCWGLKEENPEL